MPKKTNLVDATTVAFAERLANASRSILRENLRKPVTARAKGDASPVTEVDRAIESRLREMIAEAFPHDGVLGEEFGAEHADAERVWVLDPIDGTIAFMVGLPAYGSLIALCVDQVPVLGIIDQPVTGDRWLGVAGRSTTRNGNPVQTRACAALGDAVVCTTSPEYYHGADRIAFERFSSATRWTVYGGNCYVFGTLACGYADVALEALVGPYDYCALVPVVTGAGGMMSDWKGAPLLLDSADHMVAVGDPAIHPSVIATLGG